MKNLAEADGLILVAVFGKEVSIVDVSQVLVATESQFNEDGMSPLTATSEIYQRIKTVLAGVAYQETMLAAEIAEGG